MILPTYCYNYPWYIDSVVEVRKMAAIVHQSLPNGQVSCNTITDVGISCAVKEVVIAMIATATNSKYKC